MSSSIDALNGNGMSLQFEEFARFAGTSMKDSRVVRFLGTSDAATVHEVSVTTSDKVGKLFRSDGIKAANDATRAIFRNSVAAMFGGEDRIPENVKTAMKLNDYGKGKPLTARRIMIVKIAVDEAMQKMFPSAGPRISAPTAHVKPAWPEGGPVSANEVLKKGYAPAELTKLANVADMYQKATGCNLKEAQDAALDPKSDASRLFRYGGAFSANADNFKKGLALIKEFDSWFDGFINSDVNKESVKVLGAGAKLGVEKFLFEEIGCNPKLFKNIGNPESVFGPKDNLALRFLLDNKMQSISGSMASISPEKRSVVYAITQALREGAPDAKGHSFTYNVAILSRTLANFGKAAELVYSGNLNRTTAFNTLFSDFKELGLDAKSTNREISDVIAEELMLSEENKAVVSQEFKTGDHGLGSDFRVKIQLFPNMFETSGVSFNECKSAVLEGRMLNPVAGLNNVSSDDIGSLSGFTDAGRQQFLNDIYRPLVPVDTKTAKPLIDEKDNVFRFNIDGQSYTAEKAKALDKANNDGIAKAIDKFCNREVHPVQTDAVFFSMAQGGLMPQTALALQGYRATDHAPVTCTLTKDADTGTINIKYSNPENSPLKFSWTASIDVEGKITTTPIKVGES